ncbi:MAG: phosphatidate cytidylyltransferase [Planctomycetes bacterium]|nr:phosphatidate cytidylyltransferase [Planctomycetota bacterium]
MNPVLIRLLVAPILLVGMGTCLYLDWRRQAPFAIPIVLAVFSVGSFHELCAMGRRRGARPAEGLGWAALVVPYVLGYQRAWVGTPWPATVTGGFVLALLLLLIARSGRFSPLDAGFTCLAFFYVLLLSAVFLFDETHGTWAYWMLFLVVTNKGSDMAAYAIGKLVGRRKLAPALSPRKTWEGALAGLVAGTVLGVVVLVRTPITFTSDPLRLWVFPACVTVAAQLGDLAKSAVKRWADVKDSGRWIPEFGGALDMVDGFILSAPVAAWLRLYL